jgi:hypothetical protein
MRADLFGSALTRLAPAILALVNTRPQPLLAADLESLAARVQVLEDREDIRALILAYGAAHDHRDYRTFAALFARKASGSADWARPRVRTRSSS